MSIKHTAAALAAALGLSISATATADELWVQDVPRTEIITQFHGDPENADLRLFMAGNQFLVMDNLIREFKRQHPRFDEIYYVTIPPGKELQWILNRGAEWRSDGFPKVQELIKADPADPSTWFMHTTDEQAAGFKMRRMPDVYTTVSVGHMDELGSEGLVDEFFTYTHNQLSVMAHTDQTSALETIANDDTIITSTVDDGKPGFTPDGELTAEGLYRLFASTQVWISEPDIKTQGIERHIWRMYTNTTHEVFGCPGSGHPVCDVEVNDVRFPQPDNETGLAEFFAGEPDESLRKIVYFLKRFDRGVYADPSDATTFVTSVHHLETPTNINEGVPMGRLTVGPVWGTEVEFQQFREDNPEIVALRVDDAAGPDGKALNRSDDVNYLAAEITNTRLGGNERNDLAARRFLEFLKSPEAQRILELAGFIPATEEELSTTTGVNGNGG